MDEELWRSERDVSSAGFRAGWYRDPWAVGTWRWWDGRQWTPILYGDYGEAWPTPISRQAAFVPRGAGIRGGGIAAIGAGVGVAGTLAVAVIFLIAGGANSLASTNSWYLLASEIALWTGFLGAVLIASKLNGSKSLALDYGLSWPRPKDVWTGFTGGMLGRLWPLFLIVLVVLATNGGFATPNTAAPKIVGATPNGVTGWTIVVLITVVGAPIVEELFFRGLIQGALTRRIGATPAIFVTALVFAFIHIVDEGFLAPLLLFPMALILGFLKERSGRLAPGMVAHATFNATVFILFLVPAFR